MRSVYGEEYALMVETAPGAGMKVVLRVPKFSPNARAVMPGFGAGPVASSDNELTEITERAVEHTGSTPVVRPAHAKPTNTGLPAVG
jgi:two-component system LytT family sensor kinase